MPKTVGTLLLGALLVACSDRVEPTAPTAPLALSEPTAPVVSSAADATMRFSRARLRSPAATRSRHRAATRKWGFPGH
jgi:hypothetical protein